MALQLITPPASSPVTLAEARIACRLTASDTHFDALLEQLLPMAVDEVERWCGIALAAQTWRLTLDAFADAIELPRGPVSAVSSFQYSDPDGVWQTVPDELYTADLASEPQYLVRNTDQAWPATLEAVNVVRIDFVAGFTALPAALKRAVLGTIAALFDHGFDAGMPQGVRDGLWDFRRLP